MKIKNKEHLIKMFNVQYKDYPDKNIDFYKMLMAVEILRIMIDNEWVNQTVFNCHDKLDKTNRKAYDYFGSKNIDNNWQERIFRLAERVYNLRDIVNLDLIIQDIINGELVSRYAEIEVGRHLHSRLIKFEFVKPSGLKGRDYDIKIKDELEINCEVKHKIEDTEFSEKTIEKSLSKANKQLPKDNLALIFVKFPTEWTAENDYLDKIQSACNSFLCRNKDNIIAIIFRWQAPFKDGISGWFYHVLKNSNFAHNQSTTSILNKLEKIPINSAWTSIEDLIHEQLKLKRENYS